MRFRHFIVLGALALSASSCNLDVGAPRLPNLDLALDFCANETPVWFAYQNEGGPWTHILPDAAGTFRFNATYRVTIVFTRQSGSDYHTQLSGATNRELQEVSDITCLEETGSKQLNGSVAGLAGAQKAEVSMMFATTYLQAPQTSFTLQNLPDRTLDLVASRVNLTTTTQSSDRIIIRPSINPVTGSTMAVLDFQSSEAFDPTVSTITVDGISANETGGLRNDFLSAQGSAHVLYSTELTASGQFGVPAVPVARTQVGDYNDMFVFANLADGRFRGVEGFFRNPSNFDLTPDPHIQVVPAFSVVSTTPYLREHVRVNFSFDYQSALTVLIHQQFQQISVTDFTLIATQNYIGGNTAWDLTIPDFSGVEGWNNAWGLQNGTDFTWTATMYHARPSLLFGSAPEEGEGVYFAGRSSSPPPPALRAAAFRSPIARITAPRSLRAARRP